MNHPVTDPLGDTDRIALAKRLFKEYYASCFWHLRPDLEVTENDIHAIVKGLRHHGGRRGFLEAAKLVEGAADKAQHYQG